MHADLAKLIDLQSKDALVAAAEERLSALSAETSGLDQVLQAARGKLEAARRAAADGQRRRDDLETKIESYRLLQDRRRQRLEQVRNPKDASTLMTELDLAQSVMAKEENDWLRSAVLESERDEAVRIREEAAAQVKKPLRAHYDRLRRTRSNDVVVPLVGGACGACHTAIPMNRRSQIKAGTVIDACEA